MDHQGRVGQARFVKIQADSSGKHLAVSEAFLIYAHGNQSESFKLKDMLRGFVALSLLICQSVAIGRRRP